MKCAAADVLHKGTPIPNKPGDARGYSSWTVTRPALVLHHSVRAVRTTTVHPIPAHLQSRGRRRQHDADAGELRGVLVAQEQHQAATAARVL